MSTLGFAIKQLGPGSYDAFVSWSRPVTGGAVTSYYVVVKPGISGTPLLIGTVYVNSVIIHGLSNGITYYITITPMNSAGNGPATTVTISQ